MNHWGKKKTQNYNEIDNDNDNDLTHKLNKMNTWEVDRRWEARVDLLKKNAMVCWFQNDFGALSPIIKARQSTKDTCHVFIYFFC